MKRILALLLAFVMVFALAACGGGGTTPTDPNGPTNPTNPNNPNKPSAPPADEGLKGKTLQIWGNFAAAQYGDISKIDATNWIYMARAAIEEWAYINEVKLQWVSVYDQTSLMAAINSGSKPDLVFTNGQFPASANLNLLEALNEEQTAKIAGVIGDSWFLEYRGDTYGIQAPWCGAAMVYYNESMMKEYGVKTPMEYIKDGEWTWENYLKICRECTKDTNADGVIDTWGSTTYSVGGGFGKTYSVDPATGRLSNEMESAETKEWLDVIYDAVVTNPCITNTYRHATVAGSGIAMSISDCEPYNFYHTYKAGTKALSNGDVIRAVPTPTRYADDVKTFGTTTWMFAIPKGSDEVDAAVDMLTYICKAGLKWMEDHSKGIFETEYDGIAGVCEYSATWLERYNDFMEERDEYYEEIVDMWDVEFNEQMMAWYMNSKKAFGGSYAGVTTPWQGAGQFSSLFTEPPASSLPKLSAAVKAMVDTYNSLYIF